MEKKIQSWLEKDWIDKQTALKLLADVKADKERSRKAKINITVYTIAIILIGLGVITFISANDWLLELLNSHEILKIFLCAGLTFLSFWGGYKLAYENKTFPKLGNAFIVLASMLIGATYALIGQIYNINANNSGLIFLWLLSIVPVAYLFKNFAINVISIVLYIIFVVCFYCDLSLDRAMVWTIFVPILTGLVLYSIGNIPVVLNKYNNFSLSYKITGALPVFITLLILTCSVESSYNLVSPFYIIPLILLIVFNIVNPVLSSKPTKLLKIESYSMLFMSVSLLLLLILPSVCIPLVMTGANLIIIAMITFGFRYGYEFENGSIIALTNWMLIIYLTVNYSRWGWSFMDKSLFFILGGILLLSLGLFLENKRKTVIKGERA